MTKEISKWSDGFMFSAEPQSNDEPTSAWVIGAPEDPLGQIAACAKMYKGEVVRDIADVTDEERREYLREIQLTALKMPLESVSMHFMIENVHRGITHQMVRQRTAAYAQESTRFAVKEDMATAVARAVSLQGTVSLDEAAADIATEQPGISPGTARDLARSFAKGAQKWRFVWDDAVKAVAEAYDFLVNDGMPAEDARGLAPTNLLTRLNYITNLRSLYDTLAVRVSDQAQFEWRLVATALAKALVEHGDKANYKTWVDEQDWEEADRAGVWQQTLDSKRLEDGTRRYLVLRSSAWQWRAIVNEIKPIEFKIGGPAFGANFDRPSRIGERVRAYHKMGIPSSVWTEGSNEHNIPPIHPHEWLFDPEAARLKPDEEFDIYGNRVPKGTGKHWKDGQIV